MHFLIILVVILLFYYSYCYIFGRPHPKFPPGPLRWPIWGGYLQLLVENYDYPYKAMDWLARRYNTDILGMYLGPFAVVVASSNATVKEVLTRPEFQGRVVAFVPQMRDPDHVIRGQFFIDGPLWVEQRRFMLRNMRDLGFGTRSKNFEKIIEEEIRDFIDNVQSEIEGVCHKGEVQVPVVFYAPFLNLTLHLLLGARLPPQMHPKLRDYAYKALSFQRAVDPTTGMINMTPWVRHFAPQACGYVDCVQSNAEMKEFIKELVQEHKETFMTDALRDFCDMYLKEMKDKEQLDAQHWFSEEQMVMTIWDLLFPSAMAVTNTLGFAVQFLLHHPHVTRRIQQEIADVVGPSRLPTLDDRRNLPFTEAVLKETMRRQTLAALGLPHRCTEDTYLQGYFIPKGTVMLTNLWSANMDENVWDKPFDFNPDRFLDENGMLNKKDPSLPFGLGKRVCAGETFARQNMFLVFSAMCQHFTPELGEGETLPDIDHPLPGLNVTPRPFAVKLTPR